NLVRPSFYRMLAGIMRFNKLAPELLESDTDQTLGEYLASKGLGGTFVEHYLLPMTAAIWSTPPRRMLDFPARTMAAFLYNHGLLTVDDRPEWRVITGGSERWVQALVARLEGPVHTGAPVHSVRRLSTGGVEVAVGDSGHQTFDAVVMALHSDQALRCLADPSPQEESILGAIPYLENRVSLHTDPRLMPRRRRAWASWNYHLEPAETYEAPRLTYWMNRLQNLDTPTPWMVTLNSDDRLDPRAIQHAVDLDHPQFGAGSAAAKERWSEISRGSTFYCGAYWGFGFHEDGAASGVRVAEALGVPWGADAERRAA
ncbi:MAG: FAD-dependent oxidoreductase, partial [Acidobacteriota bacterium]